MAEHGRADQAGTQGGPQREGLPPREHLRHRVPPAGPHGIPQGHPRAALPRTGRAGPGVLVHDPRHHGAAEEPAHGFRVAEVAGAHQERVEFLLGLANGGIARQVSHHHR